MAERQAGDSAFEPGEAVALFFAIYERHELHLVATVRFTVPRAVLTHEQPLLEGRGQRLAIREGQTERGGVRADGEVRAMAFCTRSGFCGDTRISTCYP